MNYGGKEIDELSILIWDSTTDYPEGFHLETMDAFNSHLRFNEEELLRMWERFVASFQFSFEIQLSYEIITDKENVDTFNSHLRFNQEVSSKMNEEHQKIFQFSFEIQRCCYGKPKLSKRN